MNRMKQILLVVALVASCIGSTHATLATNVYTVSSSFNNPFVLDLSTYASGELTVIADFDAKVNNFYALELQSLSTFDSCFVQYHTYKGVSTAGPTGPVTLTVYWDAGCSYGPALPGDWRIQWKPFKGGPQSAIITVIGELNP